MPNTVKDSIYIHYPNGPIYAMDEDIFVMLLALGRDTVMKGSLAEKDANNLLRHLVIKPKVVANE